MIRVLDTSVIINLFNGDVLKLTCSMPYVYGFGSEVENECDEKILDYIAKNEIPYERIDDDCIPAANFIDLTVNKNLGEGEAECIAFGLENPRSLLFTDDLRARKLIAELLGIERLSGSIGILRELIKYNYFTSTEAYNSYLKMLEAGAFLPKLEEQALVDGPA